MVTKHCLKRSERTLSVQTALAMIPGSALNVLKEEIAHGSLKKMGKILRFVKVGQVIKLKLRDTEVINPQSLAW